MKCMELHPLSKFYFINLPQIFNGASSSKRIGCDRKISRDFKHSPRISDSVN